MEVRGRIHAALTGGPLLPPSPSPSILPPKVAPPVEPPKAPSPSILPPKVAPPVEPPKAPSPSILPPKSSPPVEPRTESGGSPGLNGGQKAGIVIGVFTAVGLGVFGGLVYKKRRSNIRRSRFGSAARDTHL
ncbi:hypothetical protein Leryth_026538 [Lithospermum erythrorhizon]|nr:hypothetical protein Leryth_026538 [Lithospermum erythrorhizon]